VSYLQVLILSIIQGACELLPVSSSAHVLVAAKLMGLDPVSPEMTFLLVMLHTGTMFAVIAYFWRAWREDYFSSREAFTATLKQVVIATVATIVVGVVLLELIEKVVLRHHEHAEVEELFGNLTLIASALAAVGVLILLAGRGRDGGGSLEAPRANPGGEIGARESAGIGAVQGLCLPFRGFSRSGATISTGLLLGITRQTAEKFSFALAVVLTPPVVAREGWRLLKAHANVPGATGFGGLVAPGLVGMVFSFLAGLLALSWLSRWLETGKWQWFGVYCLVAAAVVFWLGSRG
jgi:undecaprenyl-diphosphatase